MNNATLFTEISTLPENLQEEVADFVGFLKQKLNKSPLKPLVKERQFGIGKGSFEIGPDFDEPLEDFKDYM